MSTLTDSSLIASIGTTIWELGVLETGEQRKKYWSGRGVRTSLLNMVPNETRKSLTLIFFLLLPPSVCFGTHTLLVIKHPSLPLTRYTP